MLTGDRNGYTSAQILAALHADPRTVIFRYDLLDSSNNFKSTLDGILSGSVQNQALATIKRTARFTLKDNSIINFLSDRIKPYALLKMSGGWAEFPLGVFLLSTPPRRSDSVGNIIREVEAYDLLQILVDDKAEDRYVVAASTNYIEAVRTILTAEGFTIVNLTPTSKTLPAAKDWDPGTTKLQIINDLLSAINYKSLTMDENGVPVAEPYIAPSDRASEYIYINDLSSVMDREVSETLDLFAIPNKWTAMVSQPDRAYLTSSYTNSNASSPTSTVSRGRTIVADIENVDIADQTTLDAYVERRAFEASQVYEQVEFKTALMPIHSDLDMFTVSYSVLGLNYKYTETSWEMPLKAGTEQIHRVRRIVTI